jgi:hypothetical protein
MLLIMALVTTAMTGPLMSLFAPRASSSIATSGRSIEGHGDASTVHFREK